MLFSQTAINFGSNAISAAFGLINVFIFTRLFAPADFGVYVLGLSFAVIASTFLTTWLRLPIMRQQARGDGTDIRGIVVPGLLLSCFWIPVVYGAGLMAGLPSDAALAAAGLALAIGLFETSQELLRARLQAVTIMKATIVRAVLVTVLGVATLTVGRAGILLLISSALGYLAAVIAFSREAWTGTVINYDRKRLLELAKAGIPLTISLTLLALSTLIDRFIIAQLAGAAAAGQYTAGADLVRQALIIPAVSASAAFVPLAVQINANQGAEAVRLHLEECIEFLLAIVLPAAVGFAIVSGNIANVVLGSDFRSMAAVVMPIVSVSVIFQIMTQQYLHTSFLLSERNSFYLWSTGAALAVNIVVSYLLIERLGSIGAAWGRLISEIVGFLSALVLTRMAFPMPVPYARLARVLGATIVMALAVRLAALVGAAASRNALLMLLPTGLLSYLIMCWLLDIAKCRHRMERGILILRTTIRRPIRN